MNNGLPEPAERHIWIITQPDWRSPWASRNGVPRWLFYRVCRAWPRQRSLYSVKELQQLSAGREGVFRSALRTLEADGYIRRDGDRLSFRSNLLRQWWRKHHAGDAP